MNLELLSTDKAVLYSFPTDTKTDADAVAWLVAQGWDERGAREHVDAAVNAGAYRRIAPAKRKGANDVAN